MEPAMAMMIADLVKCMILGCSAVTRTSVQLGGIQFNPAAIDAL